MCKLENQGFWLETSDCVLLSPWLTLIKIHLSPLFYIATADLTKIASEPCF